MVGEGGIFMNGMTKAIMLVLGFALIFGVVSAAPLGGAQVVKMVQKDAYSDPAWQIVDGAFGSIMYQTDKFVFNGHGLVPNEPYALISYSEPWGTPVLVLATGEATAQGNLIINKKGPTSLIKNDYVANAPGDYQDVKGAKIWLVPASDLTIVDTTATFKAWNPATYLFETSLII